MTRNDVEMAVRQVLETLTGVDTSKVPLDQDLGATIGLDSLGRLELLAEIEDRFDLFFLDADVESATTIEGMIDTVMREFERTSEAA